MSGPPVRSAGRRLALAKGVRFTCRGCGDCCRDWPVALTPAEVARYRARDWTPLLGPDPGGGLHDVVYEAPAHGGAPGHFLRRRPDGTCLFLDADARCRLHATYGEGDKPLTCRLYPFGFVDVEGRDRPACGAAFTCSSVAAGDGAPITERRRELDLLRDELVAVRSPATRPGPFTFDRRRSYAPAEVELVLDLVAAELEDAGRPFPERVLAATHFLALLSSSSLPTLEGETPRKLVASFAAGVRDQARRGLLRAPERAPPLPERLLLRQLLALAARRDPITLHGRGELRRAPRRLGNLLSGLAFLAGDGAWRPVARDKRVSVGRVRREAPPVDPASPEADGALTRYFVAHLTARTTLAAWFAVPEVLAGLGLLFRQYPLILLFARGACLARGGARVERDDFAAALRMADWSFGHVPWTRGPIGRVRARLLERVDRALAHVPWAAERPRRAGAAAP